MLMRAHAFDVYMVVCCIYIPIQSHANLLIVPAQFNVVNHVLIGLGVQLDCLLPVYSGTQIRATSWKLAAASGGSCAKVCGTRCN